MPTLLDEAFELLQAAAALEERNAGSIEAATKYYEACYLMKRYLQRMPMTDDTHQTRTLLQGKITHYEALASSLLQTEEQGASDPTLPLSPFSKHCYFEDSGVVPLAPPSIPSPRFSQSGTKTSVVATITDKAGQANTRLAHALDLDESGQTKLAIAEYMVAAELFLESIKVAECAGSGTESVVSLLKRRLRGALDRVEQLKHPGSKTSTVVRESKVKENKAESALTEAEVAVLKRSSLIASGLFFPWSDSDARALAVEASKLHQTVWTDPDGKLKLSSKQLERFHKWARPLEIAQIRHKMGVTASLQKPLMIRNITPYTIRQKYVTDCSFIASLCICAAFERRFQKRLVTSLIHPQTQDGMPMYSSTGKYMVKLWLNGVAREVLVDDYLPIDKFGNLICSHTTGNSLELWVAIIEKAYMKLCGGYDFPGSNSGVDLFSLTGWIPERIFFPKDPSIIKDFETHPERAWERLYSASSYGDCLITMSSSGDLAEDKAAEIGLVTGHAYAVLSVIQTKNGTRLLQLKNPWGYKSWKGKFSCYDVESWSIGGIRDEVGYDPVVASQHDDGIFWISWEDVLSYFQNLHLSWNPALFPYQVRTHGFWPQNQGPFDDSFNIGENPQFILTLSDAALEKKATIWILVSRHVTKQEQEGVEATDFLTVHAHRNSGERERIWYPNGKSCVLTGAYTNNPHVLMRYDVADPADKYLTLVLSQYKKTHDLSFTLSCFSTEQFNVCQPAKELPICSEITSEWTISSAGGSPGHKSFESNPMWTVSVPDDGANIQIRCSAVKSFAINVMIVAVDGSGARPRSIVREPIIDTGNYRHGFVAAKRKKLAGGIYTLIVSTFNPGQVGAFQLKINSSAKLKVNPVP